LITTDRRKNTALREHMKQNHQVFVLESFAAPIRRPGPMKHKRFHQNQCPCSRFGQFSWLVPKAGSTSVPPLVREKSYLCEKWLISFREGVSAPYVWTWELRRSLHPGHFNHFKTLSTVCVRCNYLLPCGGTPGLHEHCFPVKHLWSVL
jgi:hypothetical protein